MAKGRLIVLEGIDGAGKSTQVKRLHAYLRSKGIDVMSHREPGGTLLGEAVREILLGYAHQNTVLGKEAEFLLFASARAELMKTKVKLELDLGKTVILDRFFASSIAYQGYGHGVNLALIDLVNQFVTKDITADKVILLDIDPSTALARIKTPADRFEMSGEEFFRTVRQGYLKYAEAHKEIVSIVDGSMSETEVFGRITAEIDQLLENSYLQG